MYFNKKMSKKYEWVIKYKYIYILKEQEKILNIYFKRQNRKKF